MNEGYPKNWKHCIIHLNPETGEMHSDGDHTVREYIEQKILVSRVELPVKPEIAEAYNKGKEEAVTEIIKQLEEYIKTGNIDFISVSLGWVEKRLRKALKQFSV